MSHVSTFELEVNDLDALDSACKQLGLELVRGQKQYRWYGRSVGDYPLPAGFTEQDLGKCDHAIRIPGNPNAYEIGVVKNRNGRGYQLLWDFWQGGYGMQAKVGKDGEKLKQQYEVQHGVRHWQRKGYRVMTTTQANGHIQLRVKK
jgi:hypothetical protein